MALNFLSSKYRILGKKGEGTFSEVLKAQNIKDGSYWACKKMKQRYESIEQVNNLREIQAMRRLSPHPNILELNEVLFDKKSGTLILVCELMDMNIYELIRGRRHYLPENKVRQYMYQLCKSIEHMHRNGIFHRDVKPENILIREDTLKLADFGSCRGVYSKQPYTEYISTRWYRAPECLLTDGYYTYKMDIWSVGCVMFEVMSLHPLFPGSNEVDQIAKIHDVMGTPDPNVLNKLRGKTRGMNFNFPTKKGTGIEKMLPHAPQECVDIILQMLIYDPEERITAKQALKHPYFKELRDAEKRAAMVAKRQKEQIEHKEQKEQEKQQARDHRLSISIQNITNTSKSEENKDNKSKDKESQNNSDNNKENEDKDADKENKENDNKDIKESKETIDKESVPEESKENDNKAKLKVSPRVNSASSKTNQTIAKYPGSILSNKDPVYSFNRKRKQRKRRMTEGGESPVVPNSFLPKVSQSTKPSTYQPSFSSTYGAPINQLPKLNSTSTTYLPSLTQAFSKPAKTKPIYGRQSLIGLAGRYDIPTIQKQRQRRQKYSKVKDLQIQARPQRLTSMGLTHTFPQ